MSTETPTSARCPSSWISLAAILWALIAALGSASSAQAAASGDDYPAQWRNIPQDSVFDSWGEYNRECTSAVAWWLHERNGFEMPFHDNANGWGPDASARGYAVNGTPAVGSVAWWGPGDHVAWVAGISGGSVTIEEYNQDFQGHYSERTIPASAPSGYIHFRDIASGAGGPPGEGSFVSHDGFVYRIAGGAPIYVSNWGAVGGPQSAAPLSDAQFASLPQYPRDGTILDSSDGHVYVAAGGAPVYVSNWGAISGPRAGVGIDQAAVDNAGGGVPWDHLRLYPADGTVLDSSSGRVFIAAGGAALYLSNWGAIGGPKPGVGIDQAAIDNAGSPSPWNHLRPYPADGTILDSSGGGVFIVAGGAPLYLSNWNAIGGPRPGVGIDQWDIDQAGRDPNAHLRQYPSDGTLIGTSGDGRVYEIVGGAPLYVSNWNAIGGARPATGVDEWDVNNTSNPAAHLRQYPSDGTFINTSTGRVYRIAGGAPIYVGNWNVFGGVQPYVNVDQWDVDNTADPHAHLRAAPLDGTLVKGLPSNQYWGFGAGLRSPAGAGPQAVAVDDAGLAAFGVRTSPADTPKQRAPRKRCHRRGAHRRCPRRKHPSHHHRRHSARASSVSSASASLSSARTCNVSFGPDPLEIAVINKRRRVSCGSARRVIGHFMRSGGGNGEGYSRGWRCVWRAPGILPGSHCTKGRRFISFQTD